MCGFREGMGEGVFFYLLEKLGVVNLYCKLLNVGFGNFFFIKIWYIVIYICIVYNVI